MSSHQILHSCLSSGIPFCAKCCHWGLERHHDVQGTCPDAANPGSILGATYSLLSPPGMMPECYSWWGHSVLAFSSQSWKGGAGEQMTREQIQKRLYLVKERKAEEPQIMKNPSKAGSQRKAEFILFNKDGWWLFLYYVPRMWIIQTEHWDDFHCPDLAGPRLSGYSGPPRSSLNPFITEVPSFLLPFSYFFLLPSTLPFLFISFLSSFFVCFFVCLFWGHTH